MKKSKVALSIHVSIAVGMVLILFASCFGEIILFRVGFDSRGGSVVSAVDVVKGMKLDEPLSPTRTGYAFSGWYKQSELQNQWNFGSDVVKSNLTLYAKWTAEDHTLSFDSNGGSGAMSSTTLLTDEETTLPVNLFTRDGFIFAGWADSGDGTVAYMDEDSYTMGLADAILYAKWNEAYSIGYILDGGVNNPANPAVYHVGSNDITLAAPSRDGYLFDEWYSDAELTIIAPTIIPTNSTGNKLYYAKWIEIHQINYHLDNGTNSSENPPSYTTESPDIDLENPTRAGHLFDGWYTDSSFTHPISRIESGSTGDIDIYAKWNKIFTIGYYIDGGTNSETNPSSYTSKSADIVLSNPSRIGYAFGGWYADSDYTVPSSTIAAGSTGDRSFYAKWTADTNTPYKVEHYQQNVQGTGFTLFETTSTSGTTDTIATASSINYTGFNKNINHPNSVPSGRVYGDGSLVLRQYYDRNTYAVRFDENGGSAIADLSDVRYGSQIEEPEDPVRAGYTFIGWYKESTFDNSWIFSDDTVLGETTLYAKWSVNDDTAYTVEHYKQEITGNGYQLVSAETEHLSGTTDTTISADVKSYPGFHENSSHVSRIPSGKISGDGSLVLKVYYDRDIFAVAFSVDGGSAVNGISGVRYGASIDEPTLPTKAGFTFAGWYKESSLVDEWEFISDIVTSATTLHAKWNINTNTLTFDANGGLGTMPTMDIDSFEEATLIANSFSRAGYTFIGWASSSDGAIVYINQDTYIMGVLDDTLYAVWSANDDTEYAVEHYKQNAPRNGYILDATERLTGTTDTKATAIAKSYTGFHENTGHLSRVEEGNIAGIGSLVLKLYYDWDTFTVEFSDNGGIIEADATNVRYGTTITEPIPPTKYGYTLGWFTELAFSNRWDFSTDTVTQDITLYSNWVANTDTSYRVEHYKQNVDYSYSLTETENLTGTTDTTAVAVLKAYQGFHEDEDHLSRMPSGNIAGYGSLVLRLYYERISYTISFSTDGGSPISDRSERYDCLLSKPSTSPEKYGYTFGGWFQDIELTNNWDFYADTITANITLHARWIKETLLAPSILNADYGNYVSIDNNIAFVGLPVTAFLINNEGKWEEMAVIQSNDYNSSDGFGRSIDIEGKYAVIGAPFDDEYADNSGSVYIFKNDESLGWVQSNKLVAFDALGNMELGTSVAISGDYLAVGTRNNSVYVYKINETTGGCDLKDVLRSSSNGFGSMVTLESDLMAVGAWADKKVFIYKRNPITDTWSMTESLSVASINSLDMNDGYVIYGNPTSSAGPKTYNVGSVSILKIDQFNGRIENTFVLDNPFSVSYDYFGYAVSISDGKSVVGAYGVSEGSKHDVGRLYLYVYDEETEAWVFESEIRASNLVSGARFGWSVDMSGDYILGGAANAFGNGSNYIFEL